MTDQTTDAMEILRRRLAAGEITVEDFDRIWERVARDSAESTVLSPPPAGASVEHVPETAGQKEEEPIAIQRLKRSLTAPLYTRLAWMTYVAGFVFVVSSSGSLTNRVATVLLIVCATALLYLWYEIAKERMDRTALIIGPDFIQCGARKTLAQDIAAISLSRQNGWHAGFEGTDVLELGTSRQTISIPLHAFFGEPRHRSAVVQHVHDMREDRADLRQLRRDLELFEFIPTR